MFDSDRTTESLLARRALAEKATPEKWNLLQIFAEDENYVGPETWADMGKAVCICRYAKDAQYIAANSPDVAMADIDEILRLRAQVERLEKEADWLISTKIVEEWNGRFVGAQNKDNSGYAVYPTKAEAVASWREAAHKAVEANHD